jgi:hypothetical protein
MRLQNDSNWGLSASLWSGHPERRAKPEVEGSLVGKGDPSTPPQAAPLRMTAHKWAKDSTLNPNFRNYAIAYAKI